MNCSMMCKFRNCILPAIFLLVITLKSMDVYAVAKDTQEPVLVVYSGRATEEEEKNVERLTGILTCQNIQVTLCEASRCEGVLQQYSRVIFFDVPAEEASVLPAIYQWYLSNHGKNKVLFAGNELVRAYEDQYETHMAARTSLPLVRGTFSFSGGQTPERKTVVDVEVPFFYQDSNVVKEGRIVWDGGEGYFYATKGNFSHISVTSLDNSVVFDAYKEKLAEWLGLRQTTYYGNYLVIQNVYPFQDPEKLADLVTILVERHIPFGMVVRPMYDKQDYPAMQRFCEALRYAQGNGGTIILHAPINQMESYSVDSMRQAITEAAEIYISNGVYPMGIQIPYNWMYNMDTRETISSFSTILLEAEEDPRITSDLFKERTNQLGKQHIGGLPLKCRSIWRRIGRKRPSLTLWRAWRPLPPRFWTYVF